jgi:hypothetical protein
MTEAQIKEGRNNKVISKSEHVTLVSFLFLRQIGKHQLHVSIQGERKRLIDL